MEPATSTYVERPPTTGGVFVGVFWRAWLVTIAGGFAVGTVANFGLMTIEDSLSVGSASAFGRVGALFGAFTGPFLAFAVAGVVALYAVPYEGEDATVRTVRRVATVLAGLWGGGLLALFFGWVGFLSGAPPSLIVAWWSAPLTVKWYVDRNEAWNASIGRN
ncbi:MAG: hypothetical protein QNJ12_00245 [Ilumatobacter sp.]|uniref:hypothetical protein n=1 Tax=Ilumatobacter sp. TaxID=1967498 RepID=UPI002613A7D6|nr:hypothetical protein [Ilumatobacter sp.]MDJ0767180.1 hypothetical protein [Ilumatobacter sp.]